MQEKEDKDSSSEDSFDMNSSPPDLVPLFNLTKYKSKSKNKYQNLDRAWLIDQALNHELK
jgi:hypothetical protein